MQNAHGSTRLEYQMSKNANNSMQTVEKTANELQQKLKKTQIPKTRSSFDVDSIGFHH